MEKRIFKSKVGYGILIPVMLVLLFSAFSPLFFGTTEMLFTMMIIFIPVITFTLYLFYSIYYIITEDDILLIKVGILYSISIKISTIRTIRKSRNIISSPASSLDRLEIKYGSVGTILISPENKEVFVQELLKINPEIKHFL